MKKKLYLIAGTMCTEKLWNPMTQLLQQDFELIHLAIPNNKNFEQLAQYYHDLLGEQPIHLVGFSLGGYIAAYYASRYPHCVEKLFIISNSPTRLPDKELHQRQEILQYVKEHGYRGISRRRASEMLDKNNQTAANIEQIQAMDRELGETTFISQYQYTSERNDLAAAIGQLNIPVQCYFSGNDALVNTQWLQQLADSNNYVQLQATSGSGHMLPLEKPLELANYVNQWAK